MYLYQRRNESPREPLGLKSVSNFPPRVTESSVRVIQEHSNAHPLSVTNFAVPNAARCQHARDDSPD